MLEVETCRTPDRGYMGDRRCGASMGRRDIRAEQIMQWLESEADLTRDTLRDMADPNKAYLFEHFQSDAAFNAHAAKLKNELAELQSDNAALRATMEKCPRMHLRQVHLNSGGYDPGGAYWGHSGQLFEAYTDSGDFMTVRVYPADISEAFKARCGVRIGEPGSDEFARKYPEWSAGQGVREAAKDMVRETYPHARFFR